MDEYKDLTRKQIIDYWHECQTEHHKQKKKAYLLDKELKATKQELLRTIHRAEMAEKYHKMLTESLERKDSIIRTLTGKFDKGVNFNRRGAKQ